MFHENNNIHTVLSTLIEKRYFKDTRPKIPSGFKSIEIALPSIDLTVSGYNLPTINRIEFDVEKFYSFFERENIHPKDLAKEIRNWDVSGWYNPIHFFGYNWGIHIREDSVYGMAYDIAQYVDNVFHTEIRKKIDKNLRDPYENDSEEVAQILRKTESIYGPYRSTRSKENILLSCCIYTAYFIIFFHELFHHFVESFGTYLSIAENRPAYRSYKSSLYKRLKLSDRNLEEALANAFTYHIVKSEEFKSLLESEMYNVHRASTVYLEERFQSDPPGYRQAINYLDLDKFTAATGLLMGQISETSLEPIRLAKEWTSISKILGFLFHDNEVRTVDVVKHSKSILFNQANLFENKAKRLQKLCGKFGYKLERVKKHEIWKCKNRETIVIPKGKVISNNVAESVLKKLKPKFRLQNFGEICREYL